MIASTMILTGSILILALAGYWMRRALKAERRVAGLASYNRALSREWAICHARLARIIALETDRMAHVGKVAVAIAKGAR